MRKFIAPVLAVSLALGACGAGQIANVVTNIVDTVGGISRGFVSWPQLRLPSMPSSKRWWQSCGVPDCWLLLR
jgi:hypothetical protein